MLAPLLFWFVISDLSVTGDALSSLAKTGITLSKHKGRTNSKLTPITELQGCYGIECIERYVAHNDGAFDWTLDSQTTSAGTTTYTMSLTSQTWLAEAMVDHDGLWNHTVSVVVPEILYSHPEQQIWAMLFINDPPSLAEEMAQRTGIVSVSLSAVPRQQVDLNFDSRGPLDEETLKAFSWVSYAKDQMHPEWPIEVPGVKATSMAMDAVQELLDEQLPWSPPSQFIISGASKRGMIAYLTALVDLRVKALNPRVIAPDVVWPERLVEQSLGPDHITVYKTEGVPQELVGEAADRVHGVITPLAHLSRLTMPKLILNVGQDNWFPPDSTKFWWDMMPSPKSFYIFGNSPHTGLMYGANDFIDVLDAWVNGLIMNLQEPELSWTIDDITQELTVRLLSNHTVNTVKVWTTSTVDGDTRDFERATWTSGDLDPNQRLWRVTPHPPTGHWQAMYVSFTFPGPKPGGAEWKRTTEVAVLPKVLPFAYHSYEPIRAEQGPLSIPSFDLQSGV